MNNIPLSNRPKLTQQDLDIGYVMRYFVQNVSTKAITEIDTTQFAKFQTNPWYETLQLEWYIMGLANDKQAKDGKLLYGTRHKNTVTTVFYNERMPGLIRKLRNPLEYFNGIYNVERTVQAPQPVQNSYTILVEEPVEPVATAITVSPESLTFNYVIGGATPTSQSVSVTADGTLSGLFITSGSSWVSASLSSSIAPTTVQIVPITTGLYSGSYNSTVVVNTTQPNVTSTQIAVTLNVTNDPEVLFIYEPGMSLSSAQFTRNTSASFNELVP